MTKFSNQFMFIDFYRPVHTNTGWSSKPREIIGLIARGRAEDNYLSCNRTSTSGIRIFTTLNLAIYIMFDYVGFWKV